MKRRLKSPRGSVFSEFAIVMPLALLICTAIFELLCFWDAQVMANHTAWQVGRIVMVRGEDGVTFFSSIDKKSKTGIKGSSMPDPLKKTLAPLDSVLQTANMFNSRANITAMALMSTCGIGYFGASPGRSLADAFSTIIEAGMKTVTDGIPIWLKDSVDGYLSNLKLPIPGFGGDFGLGKMVADLAKNLIDKAVEVAIKPATDKLGSLLKDAITNLIGKDGMKIDKLFGGKSEAAWISRRLYGAASRIARAKSKIGKEVVTIEEIEGGNFTFAKNPPSQGYMAYPQVADGDAKSDGVFVTGAHGWPPYSQNLTMLHVEINWPVEISWLFPMMAGAGKGGRTKPPVAVGHSIVMPQPSIAPENLYSTGATDYDAGSYTNAMATNMFTAIANEMKDYVKKSQFCMRFRICDQNLTLRDTDWYAYSWKECVELRDLFGVDAFPHGGEYADCWGKLTNYKAQDALMSDLRGFFSESSYKNCDYFFWDGSCHCSYFKNSLVNDLGNAGLHRWYEANKSLTYADSGANMFVSGVASLICFGVVYRAKEAQIRIAAPALANHDALYRKLLDFAARNKVNVHNMVKWQEGQNLSGWIALDEQVRKSAGIAENSFTSIRNLVRQEISEIDDVIAGKNSQYAGDKDDPVFDQDDEEVINDPAKAEKKAWDKWRRQKNNLRAMLKELDKAVVALRDAYVKYVNSVDKFKNRRAMAVNMAFVEGCLNMLVRTGNAQYFNAANDANFRFARGVTSVDIGEDTRWMLDRVKEYQERLDKAYDLEVEYGSLLGLDAAKRRKKSGKRLEDIVGEAGEPGSDSPGTLTEGSDSNRQLLDRDRQEYNGKRWEWK